MEPLDNQKKNLVLILLKQAKLSLQYNADNSYLFVNGREMLTFQFNFVSKVYLMNLVLLSLEKYL